MEHQIPVMPRAARFVSRPDTLAVLFLVAWPLAYFWRITLGQGVLFTTDIVRLFYPFSVELARSLAQGRLPLWTPGILAGFPLFAEGQVGALYLPNVLLYVLMPTHLALSYDIVLHLAWAGCGMYAWVRGQGIRAPGALLAGFVFAFNGTVFGHLSQPSVIAALSWLPWLLFLHGRFISALRQGKPNAGAWFFLAALAYGVQWLCGSVQIAFLNTLALGVITFFGGWFRAIPEDTRSSFAPRQALRLALWAGLPVILGAGLAAIQLLPTGELVGYSTRSATTESFVTSYSLPPSFLTQFVFPFPHGEPSEATGEYWSYFGVIPFFLALAALFLRRDRRTVFFALFALGALALALGDLNPAYQVLSHVPPFSFFRVPARYLYLFVLAAAFLAANGLDEIETRLRDSPRRLALIFVAPFALVLWLVATQPLDFWLSLWQILPWLIALAAGAILWLARYPAIRRLAIGLLVGIAVLDLAAYAPPFLATIDEISPIATVTTVPRSIQALPLDPAHTRVIADESVFPSLPALRGSLFPNTALIYGWESVQAYSSLAFGGHSAYLTNLSPAMLNLLNARYWMVPLEPRPETKSAAPSAAVALDILNNEVVLPPTMASGIELTTFTERGYNLSDGTAVGAVELRRRDGRTESFPLRLGAETADWDYARTNPSYRLPTIAHSFPGFWRSFGRGFDGHTYEAHFNFEPGEIIGVNVRALDPGVRLTVEGVQLCNGGDCSISVAHLAGQDDFSLAYMSDTVAAWDNLDLLPRAFVVHTAEVVDDDMAFSRLKDQDLRAGQEALLSSETTHVPRVLQEPPSSAGDAGRDLVQIAKYESQRVELAVTTDRAGYLVLADSWYPGWNAWVDGAPTTIARADFLFRAVPLGPGEHRVVFEYQPLSFWIGAIVSMFCLLAAGIVSIILYRRRVNIQ